MSSDQSARQQPAVSETPRKRTSQVGRMRMAIDQAIAVGPSFLRGDVDADRMANTMVGAVRGYIDQERAAGSDGVPQGSEERKLQNVLAELMGCGSGYLAGRCDAACVARTMTQMVNEFHTR